MTGIMQAFERGLIRGLVVAAASMGGAWLLDRFFGGGPRG